MGLDGGVGGKSVRFEDKHEAFSLILAVILFSKSAERVSIIRPYLLTL